MFCAASGQKISLIKSSIAFSTGVDEEMAQKISSASRIPMKAQLDKYLGSLPTPIKSNRRRIRMMEIEVAHPSMHDYLSNVDPHNYTNLLYAIHVIACGSLQQHRPKTEEFHLG